jgi:uncharacterized membrane protein
MRDEPATQPLPPESRWSDEHVEQFIGRLLQFGVLLAAAVTIIGAILLLARDGGTVADFRVFKGATSNLRSIGDVLRGVAALDGRAITQLGLVLLIMTPVARVALTLWAFVRQHDRLYVVVTTIVLVLLLYGLVWGKA